MTITVETTLDELLAELSPELRGQVRDFAEFLVLRQRRGLARQAAANGWPEGFFDLEGSITDPTFARPPQGVPAMRQQAGGRDVYDHTIT